MGTGASLSEGDSAATTSMTISIAIMGTKGVLATQAQRGPGVERGDIIEAVTVIADPPSPAMRKSDTDVLKTTTEDGDQGLAERMTQDLTTLPLKRIHTRITANEGCGQDRCRTPIAVRPICTKHAARIETKKVNVVTVCLGWRQVETEDSKSPANIRPIGRKLMPRTSHLLEILADRPVQIRSKSWSVHYQLERQIYW
jgi:hypothetical protein